jgi:hypothetical protein
MARPEVSGKKPTVTADDRGPPLAMSIREFCAQHGGISQDLFFKMQREGWGPTVMHVGSRTLISHEAAERWRREREVETAARVREC